MRTPSRRDPGSAIRDPAIRDHRHGIPLPFEPDTTRPMRTAAGSPARASSAITRSACVVVARHDQPDAHVERPQHVVVRHAAGALQPPKERRHLPGGTIDDGARALGQHARQIVGDAAAGDVRHALDHAVTSSSGLMSGRYDRCGASSASPIVAPSSGTRESTPRPRDVEHDPARERIAVGVQAGRRQRRSARRPARMRPAVDQPSRATTPTMKPATSYSPSA